MHHMLTSRRSESATDYHTLYMKPRGSLLFAVGRVKSNSNTCYHHTSHITHHITCASRYGTRRRTATALICCAREPYPKSLTPNPIPQTLNPKPLTPNPIHQTLYPKPLTPNPIPQTLNRGVSRSVFELGTSPLYQAVTSPLYQAVTSPLYQAVTSPLYQAATSPLDHTKGGGGERGRSTAAARERDTGRGGGEEHRCRTGMPRPGI